MDWWKTGGLVIRLWQGGEVCTYCTAIDGCVIKQEDFNPTMVHCKEPISKIRDKYSQKRNCAAKIPIFHIYVSVGIYKFSLSICLSCCRKYVDQSREYINRSQTHECGNWNWGRAIPRKGINKCNFRYSCGQVYNGGLMERYSQKKLDKYWDRWIS